MIYLFVFLHSSFKIPLSERGGISMIRAYLAFMVEMREKISFMLFICVMILFSNLSIMLNYLSNSFICEKNILCEDM